MLKKKIENQIESILHTIPKIHTIFIRKYTEYFENQSIIYILYIYKIDDLTGDF